MTASLRALFTATLLAAVAATATAISADASAPDTGAAALLDQLGQAPEAAGALIYRGTVYAQSAPDAAPVFSYERRVSGTQGGLHAHHITRDLSGAVIIDEAAQVNPDYSLQRFEAINSQQGYAGSVLVSREGRHLEYRLTRNGKTSVASEDLVDPVVTGPSLHGFILQQWSALAAGKVVPVRMVVMTKMETYGFDVRMAAHASAQTSFSITPSNWLIRRVVAPLTVTYDTGTKNLVRYEGRVPPQQLIDGKLKDLDARVDYVMHTAAYR